MSQEQATVCEWSDADASALDVDAREFVVVTADGADLKEFEPLSALLRRMRRAFGLQAAFIAEWAGGEQAVRCSPHAGAPDEPDPLHALYGRQLLEPGGSDASAWRFHAVPVVTREGLEHGTLCCRCAESETGSPPATLRSLARLIADWFDDAELSLSGFMPLHGASAMGALPVATH